MKKTGLNNTDILDLYKSFIAYLQVLSSHLFIPPSVHVSTPQISFSIFKEENGYCGNVTCWSSRGTPPVNFSLSVDDREEGTVLAAESLAAWFLVPMELGMDMGVARCWVKNEVQELMSEPLTLEVGMSYMDV